MFLALKIREKSHYTHRSADVNADRLQFAKKLGADSIHLITIGKEPRQVAQEIAKSLGRRPTAALECSGAESSIQLGLHVGDIFTSEQGAASHLPINIDMMMEICLVYAGSGTRRHHGHYRPRSLPCEFHFLANTILRRNR